jgi:hypothetical protein
MIEQRQHRLQRKGPVAIRPPDVTTTQPERPATQLAAARMPAAPRWLSVDQIRKQQRMRRETVLAAMLSGELPFEQRGRIRYARVTDVEEWEKKRLKRPEKTERLMIDASLLQFL